MNEKKDREVFKIEEGNKKLKRLNVISAIINFVYALFFGFASIYISGLMFGLFSYNGSGGSGLILFALPFLFIFAIGFLILGIFNLKNNKELKIASIETISIIEICLGVILQIYLLPLLIVSIIKMFLLSKIKKTKSN